MGVCLTPYAMPDPQAVRSMFARIAGRYDLLNHLLSAGVDRRWRREAVRAAGALEGRLVVDACCGTGDLSLALAGAGARVIALDFTPEMLMRGLDKRAQGERPLYIHADALRLPLKSARADVCTVGFGLRNLGDRGAGLREMARVVRPGGRVLVLEFTRPPGRILSTLYRQYFTRVLPRVGRWVSKDQGAYDYLPQSVLSWPEPDALCREMREVGLSDCGYRLLTRGIACIHWGTVPEG